MHPRLTRYTGLLALSAFLLFAACDQAHMESSSIAPPSATASELGAAENNTYIAVVRGNRLSALTAQVEATGGEMAFHHGPTGIAILRGLSADAAAALQASNLVSELMADIIVPSGRPEFDGEPTSIEINSPADPTTAFFFPRQWHLRAIDAPQAWAAGKLGSADVTVAVLDTGIGYTHPDLVGLVDLDRSVSFLPQDDALLAAYFPGAHPIADLDYHGTHVAATIASNAQAAAGVTSKTTLMGVKVCSVYGGCPSSAIFAGLLHAADNGADVANMSLGGYLFKMGNGRAVAMINRIFNYTRQQGTLVVVSAGNDAVNLDRFNGESVVRSGRTIPLAPATFATYCNAPGVMCVSATGPTARAGINGPWTNIDAPASYTNFGRSAITVAAPGGNGASSVTAACSPFSLTVPVCQTGVFVIGLNGTSMAAPHVSGLAALVKAEYGYSTNRISTRIQQTADDLGQRGTDPYYGKGRINVARALGL